MQRISWKLFKELGEMGRRRILAVLWAIWLHFNEWVFKGRAVSTDGVIQEVEGFVSCWCKRMSRGLYIWHAYIILSG